MLAARLHGPRDLRVEEMEPPTPGEGEVRVRVAYAGLCGSDLHVWRTGDFVPAFPVTPGHEVVGEVEPVNGSPGGKPRWVVLDSRVPCRQCEQCALGQPQRCARLGFLGEVRDGGFAQVVCVPARDLWAVPEGLTPEVAVLAEPTAVVLHARRTLVRLMPEARSLTVLGAGPIGVLATLVQPESTEVTLVEPDQLRARQAAEVTGRRVVAGAGELPPADAVLDCAGFKGSLEAALAATRPGGTVLVLALHHAREEVDANQLVASEHLVVGCHVFADEMGDALALLAAQSRRFSKVVSRVLSLGDLPAAVEETAGGAFAGLKLVVKP